RIDRCKLHQRGIRYPHHIDIIIKVKRPRQPRGDPFGLQTVLENTRDCDVTGMFSFLSTETKYPCSGSNSSLSSPSANFWPNRPTGSSGVTAEYATAGWSAKGDCNSIAALLSGNHKAMKSFGIKEDRIASPQRKNRGLTRPPIFKSAKLGNRVL